MNCPKCDFNTKVLSSRIRLLGKKRRRRCKQCHHTFETYEITKSEIERLRKPVQTTSKHPPEKTKPPTNNLLILQLTEPKKEDTKFCDLCNVEFPAKNAHMKWVDGKHRFFFCTEKCKIDWDDDEDCSTII